MIASKGYQWLIVVDNQTIVAMLDGCCHNLYYSDRD